MPETFAVVALITLAAGALAVAGILAYRIIWPAREPRQEPVSPAGTTTPARTLLLRLVRRAQRDPAPVHVGATEADGAFFRAVREDLETHPGFTQEIPVVPADEADYVAEFEAHMAQLADDFADRVYRAEEHAGRECERALMTYAPDASTTGEIDRAELDKLLEGVGA